jgi:hypothetical protein
MDMIPGGNPADALAQVSKEMQEKFDEAGMAKVEELTSSLETLQLKLKEGPGDMMDALQDKIKELIGKVKDMVDKPPMPDSPLIACVGSMYVNAVKPKLEAVKTEVDAMMENMSTMANSAKQSLKDVGDGLNGAMEKMEGAVTALANLPKAVSAAIKDKDSPEDIGNINTEPMKKALQGGDIGGPLSAVQGLQEVIKSVVSLILQAVQDIGAFVSSMAKNLVDAFAPPFPCCCLSDLLPEQAKTALLMVDAIGKIDLSSLEMQLSNAAEKIGAIDVEMIKKPVETFSSSAKDLVDKLDKTVSAAKMSSGGGTGLAGSVI